ncbi:transposase [Microseira wollei NIES-4236]|uniref:Transposase n=1 Tax=Microseira wollei NIES-4236 TaxID=2530354 RepID=A0AAV3XKT3_9CYAN|nr:transposase [Microseira wollei]GET41234.1 transposase [Microseira wollei NIES-4236]
MAKHLTQLKKLTDRLWLQEATATTLQQSLGNLETAFKTFFAHRAKFPKFKSKNSKQVKRVAKVHDKIANTRQDFLHKLSRKLVDENQVIGSEKLNKKRLARSQLAK